MSMSCDKPTCSCKFIILEGYTSQTLMLSYIDGKDIKRHSYMKYDRELTSVTFKDVILIFIVFQFIISNI